MKKLRELRMSKNMSQSVLAMKIGLSKNTICNYERGHRNPKINNLKKMAEVLGCNVKELLD